jgi:hypothetical protein
MEVFMSILILCAGVIIGCIVTKLTTRNKPIGTLRIDNSDPDDGPYLFLELKAGTHPNSLKNVKYVTFQVKAENFISQD